MIIALTVRAQVTQVIEDFGVEDGRADFVDAGGPLAEVDLAAAVGAEGEVFVGKADQHAAGGAAEDFGGFFLRGHGAMRCGVLFYVNAAADGFLTSTMMPLAQAMGSEKKAGWDESV
jgi:hypothetical protein